MRRIVVVLVCFACATVLAYAQGQRIGVIATAGLTSSSDHIPGYTDPSQPPQWATRSIELSSALTYELGARWELALVTSDHWTIYVEPGVSVMHVAWSRDDEGDRVPYLDQNGEVRYGVVRYASKLNMTTLGVDLGIGARSSSGIWLQAGLRSDVFMHDRRVERMTYDGQTDPWPFDMPDPLYDGPIKDRRDVLLSIDATLGWTYAIGTVHLRPTVGVRRSLTSLLGQDEFSVQLTVVRAGLNVSFVL